MIFGSISINWGTVKRILLNWFAINVRLFSFSSGGAASGIFTSGGLYGGGPAGGGTTGTL